MAEEEKFETIIVLVNAGFSDVVMKAARSQGARGGTIIHSRGTAPKEVEEKYNIVITPDKEMILILVSTKIKDQVLKAIYEQAGLGTKGQGIAFSIPVESVAGIKK